MSPAAGIPVPRQRRPGPPGRRPWFPPLLLLFLACQPAEDSWEPGAEAWLLHGLVLVPAPAGDGAPPLLLGRFEVTAAEFRGGHPRAGAEALLPATGLSHAEARAWARQRGLRLPRWEEWAALAGRSAYPWGEVFRWGHANTLELGIGEPLPVGVFESGRSPYGAYDLVGNVWEWLEDVPPLDPHEEERLELLGSPAVGGLPRAAAAGGSWAAAVSRGPRGARGGMLRVWRLEAGTRSGDLGFRVAGEALPWMLEHGQPLWLRAGEKGRAWIREVFRAWDPGLRRQLARALEEAGADRAFCAALREPGRP